MAPFTKRVLSFAYNCVVYCWLCAVGGLYNRLGELYITGFHKPGPTEAGQLGLMRGTCFVASRLELAAVAVLLLCFWWCVLIAVGFLVLFFFPANTHSQLVHRVPGELYRYKTH